MSKNGRVTMSREGAPLPSEAAGAEIEEMGPPRTCRPDRGTDPAKNEDKERDRSSLLLASTHHVLYI